MSTTETPDDFEAAYHARMQDVVELRAVLELIAREADNAWVDGVTGAADASAPENEAFDKIRYMARLAARGRAADVLKASEQTTSAIEAVKPHISKTGSLLNKYTTKRPL